MARKTIHFTKKTLEELPLPSTGRCAYYDSGCKGLQLLVSAAGGKVFYFRGTLKGEQERKKVGPFPEFSLDEARKRADAFRVEFAKGNDPFAEIKAKKSCPTLDAFFQKYLEMHAKKAKKTWQYDENTYTRLLAPHFGQRQLHSIGQEEVAKWHTRLGEENGHSMANHALSLLTQLFNKARQWGDFEGQTNPTQYLKKYKEYPRSRYLSPDEMRLFMQALSEELNTDMRDAVFIGLLTAARRSNVLAMRWGEIDWGAQLWHIPITKNGLPVTLPLHPILMLLLKQRRLTVEGEWVFPSDSRTGHMLDYRSSWKNLLKRAGVKNLTPHDLRRTMASWLGKGGGSGFLITKALGQVNAKSAQVYTHLNVQDVQIGFESVIAEMVKEL
jgi:integrase